MILDEPNAPYPEDVAARMTYLQGMNSSFDGMVVGLKADPGKKPADFTRIVDHEDSWGMSQFSAGLDQLKGLLTASSLKHSFLDVGFGDQKLDFFDDLGWRETCHRVSLAAEITKASPFDGIFLRLGSGDAKYPQFTYFGVPHWQDHKRVEMEDKVRTRGQEFMDALIRGNPRVTLLTPGFLGDLVRAYDANGKPTFRDGEEGDLLPAFVNGLLDEINGSATLHVSPETPAPLPGRSEFLRIAQRTAWFDSQLLAPEVQDRYRARVQFAGGIGFPEKDDKPATYALRVRESLVEGLSVSGKYVWFHTSLRALGPALTYLAPTEAQRLRRALVSSETHAYKPGRLTSILTAGPNMAINGETRSRLGWEPSFAGDGAAELDLSKGTPKLGSLTIRGVRQGSWSQDISVSSGAYALRASTNTLGLANASLEVDWKDRDGIPVPGAAPVAFVPNSGSGWQTIIGGVDVPDGAATMTVRLVMLSAGQPGDQAWFCDIHVVPM